MGISAAIATAFYDDSPCVRRFCPFCRRQRKCVQTSFFFKPLEFEGFKTRIVKRFPNAKIFYRVAVSEPVCNNGVRLFGLEPCNVSKRNKIRFVIFDYGNDGVFHIYFLHLNHAPFLSFYHIRAVLCIPLPVLGKFSRNFGKNSHDFIFCAW